jgi:hypothetical protein
LTGAEGGTQGVTPFTTLLQEPSINSGLVFEGVKETRGLLQGGVRTGKEIVKAGLKLLAILGIFGLFLGSPAEDGGLFLEAEGQVETKGSVLWEASNGIPEQLNGTLSCLLITLST